MPVERPFRRRLRSLINQKYRSLDRFYLETGFSKGHLSDILRGKGSPSISTIERIAAALEVEVLDLFIFPEDRPLDRAVELLRKSKPETVQRVLRLLRAEHPEDRKA
jgi:transcriptional regulator with XRE-family HTH domain